MRIVLYCSSMGMRHRGNSDLTPKPLVEVGDRPTLRNLKYYARFGQNESSSVPAPVVPIDRVSR